MFEEIKNRDAWSTLRGFVYQVDNTILRWLSLKDNEVLEPEKGEDIDVVTHDLQKKEISRELGQVKYRESSISLNQKNVIDILINFYEHKVNNVDKNIYFQFISNTKSVVERPSLFINGKSGIEAWEELQNIEAISTNDKNFIAIKKHLIKKANEILNDIAGKSKEEDSDIIYENKLKGFVLYIGSDENFINFIRNFEWSLGSSDYERISDLIKEKIISLEIARDSNDSSIVYSKLFYYLFKILCKKGLKRIDNTDLRNQVKIEYTNDRDKIDFAFINNVINQTGDKIDELQKIVLENTSNINDLFKKVSIIDKVEAVFEFKNTPISVSPPLLIKNGVSREEKVSLLYNTLKKYSWVNFQGVYGSGRSQLAALTAEKFDCCYWLNFKKFSFSEVENITLVESFLETITSRKVLNDRYTWLEEIKNYLQDNTLIVFDDLPRLDTEPYLSQILIRLSNKIIGTNIKIISISNFKIYEDVKSYLEEEVYYEYTDFDFSKKEIEELLQVNNADESVFKYIDLISSTSKRNPRLVNAIVKYLKKIDWGKNSYDLLDTFFGKEFSKEITYSSQNTIKTYIKDESSKELLYRLSLIHWDLKLENIIAISNVKEVIKYPEEKLQDLLYVWIQEQQNSFQISPLIRDIGENNLPENVQRNVHIAVAKSLTSGNTINQISATRIITSFIKGKDLNSAGMILLNVYQSANTIQEANSLIEWGYLNYWIELDIPKEMSLPIRTTIRGQQIRLFGFIQRNSDLLFKRLEEYSKEDNHSITDRLFVHITCVINYRSIYLQYFWEHIDFIFTNFDKLDLLYGDWKEHSHFYKLLLLPANDLRFSKDVALWFKYIEMYEEKSSSNFFLSFDSNVFEAVLTILCEHIYNNDDYSWEEKITIFKYLSEYFKNRRLEVFSIIPLKSVIGIVFSVFEEVDKAEILTNDELSNVTEVDSKYLLCENLGRLYFYNKDVDRSKNWFSVALATNCTYQLSYISTLLSLATIYSNEDSRQSMLFCRQALDLASERSEYSELDIIEIYGELAIAYWINKDIVRCLDVFEDIIIRLMNIKTKHEGKRWIKIFVMSANTLGYISSVVGTGRVPEFESKSYVEPKQGNIFFTTSDLSHYYHEENNPILLSLLALFSYGVGDIKRAGLWSLKAFDLARKIGDKKVFVDVTSVCREYTIINFYVEEAFESSMLHAAVYSHKSKELREGYLEYNATSVWEMMLVKPSAQWNAAEEFTIGFTVIPLYVMILTDKKNSEKSEIRFKLLLNTIRKYMPKSSNLTLWEVTESLIYRIYTSNVTVSELVNRGNVFTANEQRHLFAICALGVIYLSQDSKVKYSHIMNIFPYFSVIFESSEAIMRYVLLPFLKEVCLSIFDDVFIENEEDLNGVREKIEKVTVNYKRSFQSTIKPLFDYINIELPEDRVAWLFMV